MCRVVHAEVFFNLTNQRCNTRALSRAQRQCATLNCHTSRYTLLKLYPMDTSSSPSRPNGGRPSLQSALSRSLPSSQSIHSTISPGTSTPGSWNANPWLRGTPDTSPPSSGATSPQLKAQVSANDGSLSPVEGSLEGSRDFGAAKSICFVGAGFVGMISICLTFAFGRD